MALWLLNRPDLGLKRSITFSRPLSSPSLINIRDSPYVKLDFLLDLPLLNLNVNPKAINIE